MSENCKQQHSFARLHFSEARAVWQAWLALSSLFSSTTNSLVAFHLGGTLIGCHCGLAHKRTDTPESNNNIGGEKHKHKNNMKNSYNIFNLLFATSRRCAVTSRRAIRLATSVATNRMCFFLYLNIYPALWLFMSEASVMAKSTPANWKVA